MFCRFLFTTDGKGGVKLVHCHPEDHKELVVIKKAMVSIFSVTVKVNVSPPLDRGSPGATSKLKQI